MEHQQKWSLGKEKKCEGGKDQKQRRYCWLVMAIYFWLLLLRSPHSNIQLEHCLLLRLTEGGPGHKKESHFQSWVHWISEERKETGVWLGEVITEKLVKSSIIFLIFEKPIAERTIQVLCKGAYHGCVWNSTGSEKFSFLSSFFIWELWEELLLGLIEDMS